MSALADILGSLALAVFSLAIIVAARVEWEIFKFKREREDKDGR